MKRTAAPLIRVHPCSSVAIILLAATVAAAPVRKTDHVVLMTADGLRWQEVFRGIDPALMKEKAAGMEDAAALRERLWRATPTERRAALMPWFWGTLAARGVVFDNVRVTNAYRVSYPGYSEMLTGRAQDDVIRGNDPIRNPTPTVLEFVREKLKLAPPQVALFGSWETLGLIGASRRGAVYLNAGYEQPAPPATSARMLELGRLQFRVLEPDRTVRHDYVTFAMAVEYLKTVHPRLLHVALGETDDWAHLKRYDRVLDTIGEFDRCLGELWDYLQSDPEYRGRTTLIVATDHGRGSTTTDWSDHGKDVPGADRIWLAMLGPDTPPTGIAPGSPAVFQRDIAPTILELLGIDYREYRGVQGHPIRRGIP